MSNAELLRQAATDLESYMGVGQEILRGEIGKLVAILSPDGYIQKGAGIVAKLKPFKGSNGSELLDLELLLERSNSNKSVLILIDSDIDALLIINSATGKDFIRVDASDTPLGSILTEVSYGHESDRRRSPYNQFDLARRFLRLISKNITVEQTVPVI